MADFTRRRRGNPVLATMLRTICNLYPEYLSAVRRRMNQNGFVMSEKTVLPLLDSINRVKPLPTSQGYRIRPNLRIKREDRRPVRSGLGILLPTRFIFRGPFVRITYEGEHITPERREFAARLIYEFFDAPAPEKAQEMACLIFPYEGKNRQVTHPKVRTTRAFRAYETQAEEDFKALQNFLYVMTREEKVAELLKLLTVDARKFYGDKDELPRSLLNLEALFRRPAPAFVGIVT